jgi:hypothetical protein
VKALDQATGEVASTRITLSSGLSEGEIQDIVDRGVADRVTTQGATPPELVEDRELEDPACDDLVPLESTRSRDLTPDELEVDLSSDAIGGAAPGTELEAAEDDGAELLDVDDSELGELTEELEILDTDESGSDSAFSLFDDASVDLTDEELDPEPV